MLPSYLKVQHWLCREGRTEGRTLTLSGYLEVQECYVQRNKRTEYNNTWLFERSGIVVYRGTDGQTDGRTE